MDGKGAAVLCCMTTLKCLANLLLTNCFLIDNSDHNYTVNKESPFTLMSIHVTQDQKGVQKECAKVRLAKHKKNPHKNQRQRKNILFLIVFS